MFKISFRYLWKNKLFSSLNILGLAIGISSCWIILSIVQYELDYESKIPEKEKVFRLVSGITFDDKETFYGGVSAPIYQGVRESIADVKAAIPVYGQWIQSVKVESDQQAPLIFEEQEDIIATDAGYFEMVPYKWLAGNAATALQQPEAVILTSSRAALYFPGVSPEDLLGKTITYEDTIRKTITGIVADLDFPTDFSAQEITYLQPKVYSIGEWTNTNGSDRLYLILHNPSNALSVQEQIEALAESKWQQNKRERNTSSNYNRRFQMVPLKEMHFSTYINEWQVRKVSRNLLYGLIGTAAFLLILACINYINLSTAQIPQRGKEIGVRKTLGSSKSSLISQIVGETAILVAIATVLSIALTKIGFTSFSNIIPEGAPAYQYAESTLLFLLFTLLITILITGIYPAIQISKVNPIESIKNGLTKKTGRDNFNLRKSLIVFQYTIAQCFIIGALIMGQQLKYTIQKDLGFNKDAVVLIDIPWQITSKQEYAGKESLFAEELKKLPGIKDISRGDPPLKSGFSSSMYTYTPPDGKDPVQRQLQRKVADTHYLNFYNIELIAGSRLQQSDTIRELLLNEKAIQEYGIASAQEAIGQMLKIGDRLYPIAGVVKNFHTQDFYNDINPVVIMTHRGRISGVNIKLADDVRSWQATLEAIRQTWNQIYPPEHFEYKFYDESIASLYQQEKNMSKLVNTATGISIFIGCLGLFGLATLTAFQRTKEIGIRKVLGASVTGIISMLSKDFVKLVLVAVLIASPIAWWAMNRWLENFAYKITISPFIFIIAGLLAIVIAIVTVSTQAVKAAITNPVNSLRDE